MPKTKKFSLVTHVCKMKSQIFIFLAIFLLLWNASNGKEEAWLSAIFFFKSHVRIAIRANFGFKMIIFLIFRLRLNTHVIMLVKMILIDKFP